MRNLFGKINTPSVSFSDVSENFCNQKTRRCKTTNEVGELLYYDDNHLSSLGSEYIVDDIINWLVRDNSDQKSDI